MSELEIVWQDPPAHEKRSLWQDRLAPLRERPNQWARVRVDTPARISGLRQRLRKTAAMRDFELRSHKVSEQVAELYVRYMPGES